jgi:hypothetical protein
MGLRYFGTFQSVLELEHGLPLLVVIGLKFTMFGVCASAKFSFSSGGACRDNTNAIQMVVELTKPLLDMREGFRTVLNCTAWMTDCDTVSDCRTDLV